jgi:capsule polysaccharide export protein KpsE/RkpR
MGITQRIYAKRRKNMVSFTLGVAKSLIRQAATLFRAASGLPISEDYEYETEWNCEEGLIDEVSDEDFALKYWMNSVLLFLRTVAGILTRAVEEEEAAQGILNLPDIVEDE